jgi:spermidine/putrescine-binding protein
VDGLQALRTQWQNALLAGSLLPDLQCGLCQPLAANSATMWQGVDDAKTLKGLSLAVVWGFSIPTLAEQGEIWKIAEPKEGTTSWVDNFALSYTLKDKPKLREIAEAWLNFTLSDEYQLYTVRGLACAPVTANAADLFTEEEVTNLHLNDPEHFEKNRILWKILDKKDRNGLKRLWDKALQSK